MKNTLERLNDLFKKLSIKGVPEVQSLNENDIRFTLNGSEYYVYYPTKSVEKAEKGCLYGDKDTEEIQNLLFGKPEKSYKEVLFHTIDGDDYLKMFVGYGNLVIAIGSNGELGLKIYVLTKHDSISFKDELERQISLIED